MCVLFLRACAPARTISYGLPFWSTGEDLIDTGLIGTLPPRPTQPGSGPRLVIPHDRLVKQNGRWLFKERIVTGEAYDNPEQ